MFRNLSNYKLKKNYYTFSALECVSRSSRNVRVSSCTSRSKRQLGNDFGISNLYSGKFMSRELSLNDYTLFQQQKQWLFNKLKQ